MKKPQLTSKLGKHDEIIFENVNEVLKWAIEKSKGTKMQNKKLRGFIQSGIIFIGDPSYMAGDMSQPGSEDAVDPTNPFKNWDKFTAGLKDEDCNMPFPGAIEDNTTGRGVVIQTGLQNGQYEIVKEYNEAGKLSQLVIKIRE